MLVETLQEHERCESVKNAPANADKDVSNQRLGDKRQAFCDFNARDGIRTVELRTEVGILRVIVAVELVQ